MENVVGEISRGQGGGPRRGRALKAAAFKTLLAMRRRATRPHAGDGRFLAANEGLPNVPRVENGRPAFRPGRRARVAKIQNPEN